MKEVGRVGNTPESLSFFLPVHNEAQNVYPVGQATIDTFAELELDFHLTIVNDGSTDDTYAAASQLRGDNPGQVTVLSHETNRGYGAALRTGLTAGMDSTRDYVGFMDGDGQFQPSDVQVLLGSLQTEKSDAAIGIRSDRQDQPHRIVLGKAWKQISRRILDCPVTDVDCGFKVFRRESLERFVPQLTSERGGGISPEIIARGRKAGLVFSEAAVKHMPRMLGDSSGSNPAEIIGSIKDLLTIRSAISKQ